MRQDFVLIGVGILVAALLIAASYSVAPELLQISLPDVEMPGEETTPPEDPPEMPDPTETGDPGPTIPPCATSLSLLELEDPEEEPFDEDPTSCGAIECDLSGRGLGSFSDQTECIEAGKIECRNAVGPQMVTVHVCPGSATEAAGCTPEVTDVPVSGDCSVSNAPGCGAVISDVTDVTACTACWKESDSGGDPTLSCEESATTTIAVNTACRPGPPHPGQTGVVIESSGCAYDTELLECYGTCSVTLLDQFNNCQPTPGSPAHGQCKDANPLPPPLPGPAAASVAEPIIAPSNSPSLMEFFDSFF